MQGLQKQQGVALIIVLLIVAIVTVLATQMGSRLQLQVKRATNIKENNQAYWYAMGAEQYAANSLQKLEALSDGIIHLEQPWAERFVFPAEGGGIEAQLVDMQACFNLNGLRDANSQANSGQNRSAELNLRLQAFERLMSLVNQELAAFSIETVRDSLADWLDADDTMSPLGAEDSEYEGRQFPYLAANNYMSDKSELRLVNGVEAAWLQPLLQHVCVLPNDNSFKLNVNTVTEQHAAVLAALAGLTLGEASAVIGARPPQGFKQVEDFFAVSEVSSKNLSNEQKAWFDVKSQYFKLQTKAAYNNANFAMQTVFKVDKQDVTVLKREFGNFEMASLSENSGTASARQGNQ